MKELCCLDLKSISGGAQDEVEFYSQCLIEELEDGNARFSMFLVLEGDLKAIEESLTKLM